MTKMRELVQSPDNDVVVRGQGVFAKGILITVAILVLACSDEETPQASAREVLGGETSIAAREAGPEAYALTTLPTSGVVVAGKTGAVCYSHDGKEQWRFELPAGEQIVARPAVAPDSSTFLLTNHALVALSIRGEVIWTVSVEPADLASVLALGDGSAVVTQGTNTLVNYESGRERWRFQLPDKDTITSLPRVASNSNIFVQGVARLYVVDPSGVPVWDLPI